MLTAVQELALIARCATLDDREAFATLVEEYTPALKRFLFNLTSGNAVLTDDLAQETFLKSWLNLRSFKGLSRFKTWLFRIAYNEFVSACRKNMETVDLSHTDASVPEVEFQDELDNELDLKKLIDTLPAKEKAVTLLYYYEDCSIKKISKITDMPEGSVKAYLSRSRNKLKSLLS